jgi:DNA-binding NtrC family response regulator
VIDPSRDMTVPVVLIADDDAGIRAAAERFISRQGFRIVSAADGREALATLSQVRPEAALVDLQMPYVDGLEVLRAMRELSPDCQVILMTANPTMDSAIEAVKLGARDYITKPFDFERLNELLTSIRERLARRFEQVAADGQSAERTEFCGMIGRSAVMQDLFDSIRRLAPHVRTALITGETGTGKELVARALHQIGPRRNRAWVAYNCSAVVETLFESEFFGHTRGAFTGASDAKAGLFEAADGGTLFLDEVGELPHTMQAKLLRVVEYGEIKRVGATQSRHVDVQVIAATNRDLQTEVRAGRFRQDLFYRLDVVELKLAPLRERREDIPYITAAVLKELSRRLQKRMTGLTAGAERVLQHEPWPGNVRELRNTIERAFILADGHLITERDIMSAVGDRRHSEPPAPDSGAISHQPRHRATPHTLTREQVDAALYEAGGNRSAAARRLGLSRRALYRRLDTFGLR